MERNYPTFRGQAFHYRCWWLLAGSHQWNVGVRIKNRSLQFQKPVLPEGIKTIKLRSIYHVGCVFDVIVSKNQLSIHRKDLSSDVQIQIQTFDGIQTFGEIQALNQGETLSFSLNQIVQLTAVFNSTTTRRRRQNNNNNNKNKNKNKNKKNNIEMVTMGAIKEDKQNQKFLTKLTISIAV